MVGKIDDVDLSSQAWGKTLAGIRRVRLSKRDHVERIPACQIFQHASGPHRAPSDYRVRSFGTEDQRFSHEIVVSPLRRLREFGARLQTRRNHGHAKAIARDVAPVRQDP